MRILIATPEAVPYAKTGGLADVAGALLKEFRLLGEDASLILPLYRTIKDNFSLRPTGRTVRVKNGGRVLSGEVWASGEPAAPHAYFIECDELYGRAELYGTAAGDYKDNALRFAFFSKAVLETCRALQIRPDVIHCNDWQTGLLPLYLKDFYRGVENFKETSTLYTIHNLGYQGLFPPSDIGEIGLGWEYFTPEKIEFYGKWNFMKAGILYSDLLNTVSHTYAAEILEKQYGFGLEGVLRKRRSDLYGVLNGVDYHEWDPAADGVIAAKYGRDDFRRKMICKKALLSETGLRNKRLPLLGVVSRLSSQKGMDLIAPSISELVSLGLNVVMLGKGEERFQDALTDIARRHKGRVFLKVGFEEAFARRIYAGSDFFLMPSRYEPCGLGQLIALRYGCIPVARRTGGLADTIRDYDHLSCEGTGFLFTDYTPSALRDGMKRALCVYVDAEKMGGMVGEAMGADFSWSHSAERYLALYRKAVKRSA